MTMKQLLVTVCLCLGATGASAQDKVPLPSTECGSLERGNTGHQYGDGSSPWLEYIVETKRELKAACLATVAVDGRVVNRAGSAGTKSGSYVASLRKPVPVDNYGRWQIDSQHRFTHMGITFDMGSITSFVEVVRRDEEDPADDGSENTRECAPEEPCEAPSGSGGDSASPLLIDLSQNGYALTAPADGVWFDLDADGIAERVAWTVADTDEAFLALDRNGNGRIDDGSELFGDHTEAYLNSKGVTTPNGFEALRFTEGPSYGFTASWDEVIDTRDAVFSRLLLWTDRNHNGLSEPEEIRPLGESGISAISTFYKTAGRRDAHGNEFRQRAKATRAGGEFFIYDVWLKKQ
jgi:hypothetical protein